MHGFSRNPSYAVVKFRSLSDAVGTPVSRHGTLAEAQAAHARLVRRADGSLRPDYQDYGIVDVVSNPRGGRKSNPRASYAVTVHYKGDPKDYGKGGMTKAEAEHSFDMTVFVHRKIKEPVTIMLLRGSKVLKSEILYPKKRAGAATRKSNPARTYAIHANGMFMGNYRGSSKDAAIRAYVKDAGYRSVRHAAEVLGKSEARFLAEIDARAVTAKRKSNPAKRFEVFNTGGVVVWTGSAANADAAMRKFRKESGVGYPHGALYDGNYGVRRAR